MSSKIRSHVLSNGLTLVAEQMPWLQSAAFSVLLPAGSSYDPQNKRGLGNLLCDMVQRGCGDRDSRQYVEDLDNLGVARGSGITNAHTSFGGAVLADNLFPTLSIFADVVRNPHLPEAQFEEGQMVCYQELRALEDDLGQQTMIGLRRQMYPDPYGRAALGNMESVAALTPQDAQQHFEKLYQPSGTILSVAGNIDWDQLLEQVESLFGDWKAGQVPQVELGEKLSIYEHTQFDSQQTHLGIGFPGVPYSHPDYFRQRGAIGVMSDGMASRLFSEVREKRGLCYTVYASCHTLLDQGSVLCYSGTSADRAQETLDVMIEQLQLLAEGIHEPELKRLKTRIKSALVMQQESSSSRASSIAADWYYLNRVRTLDEVNDIIDGLSCEGINEYLKENPPSNFRVTTTGSKKLEMPVGISADNA